MLLKGIFVLLLIMIPFRAVAQSMVGTTGLFNVPTAHMPEDGTLTLGGGFIPGPYVSSSYSQNRYDVGFGYASLVFLPRLELMFRYTRNLNMPEEVKRQLFMDRMINVRVQVLRDKDLQPALVVGLHDAAGKIVNEETRAHFAANYLVMSKHLDIRSTKLGLHAGYAFEIFGLETKTHDGLFGGLNLMPLGDERLELIVEHDSRHANIAARALLFRHLRLSAGLWEMKKPGWSIGMKKRLKS